LPGYVERNYESAMSEYSASQPIFEPGYLLEYKFRIHSHTDPLLIFYTASSLSFVLFPIFV
jgi:hypothetical protein